MRPQVLLRTLGRMCKRTGEPKGWERQDRGVGQLGGIPVFKGRGHRVLHRGWESGKTKGK